MYTTKHSSADSCSHPVLHHDVNYTDFDLDEPAIAGKIAEAMATINQTGYSCKSIRDLRISSGLWQNPLNKCQDCAWFNKTANFCAVAPKNLTSLECGDRQLPEPSENLDYLNARSPERIALIQSLAQKLDIEPEMLEQKLFQGWLKNRELFNSTAKSELFKTQIMEIKTLGTYSIAQMELIRDAIGCDRNSVPLLHTYLIVNRIKGKILAGCDFDDIMRSLLSVG